MSGQAWARVASMRTAEAFRAHLRTSGIRLDLDDTLLPASDSPFGRPIEADGLTVGNRFCILPMEGWDGTAEGRPGELTRRRWGNFGRSGAKLIWGGEAVAVRRDGRANPAQLVISPDTWEDLARLREEVVRAHVERFGAGADADLVVGLQLTHSGRYSRPDAWDRPVPLAVSRHPVLDRRFTSGLRLLSDAELDWLVDDFVEAARLAHRAGFQFVDLKHCHGYLAHELLGARHREGRYGGSFENRTRLLRSVIDGIRAETGSLRIGVRFSAFDTVPYHKGADGVGVPEDVPAGYDDAFGLVRGSGDADLGAALDDARQLLSLLSSLDVKWTCLSAGSPYSNPHIQRPALFPPSDGYGPPEDPLAGVARQIRATALLKAEFPTLVLVGSAYTYLQEWLPHVGQRVLRDGGVDLVGLGRMVLSYPDLPADVLEGRPPDRRRLCRTFSDCTTAPRSSMPSGCYPLDSFYGARPEAKRLQAVKAALRS